MSKTLYFPRKKNMDIIEEILVNCFKLEICLKHKKERIFKNTELLITCKDKYVSVLVYDGVNNGYYNDIIKFLN